MITNFQDIDTQITEYSHINHILSDLDKTNLLTLICFTNKDYQDKLYIYNDLFFKHFQLQTQDIFKYTFDINLIIDYVKKIQNDTKIFIKLSIIFNQFDTNILYNEDALLKSMYYRLLDYFNKLIDADSFAVEKRMQLLSYGTKHTITDTLKYNDIKFYILQTFLQNEFKSFEDKHLKDEGFINTVLTFLSIRPFKP